MKWIICLSLTALLPLHAQTGDTAVSSAQAAKSTNWQNWVFLATACITATAAIFFIATDSGRHAPD